MIKNNRQYRITRSQSKKFEEALQQLHTKGSKLHPLLQKAQKEAILSQLEDLRAEMREYEALRSGIVDFSEIENIERLPEAIIKARIASGLTQKNLAEQIGLKEQQIQRYEATDYKTASFGRLLEIANILNLKLKQIASPLEGKLSLANLSRRMKETGIDLNFILRRLVPSNLVPYLESSRADTEVDEGIAIQVARIIGKIYGWSSEDIFGEGSLQFDTVAAGTANFKVPSRAEERRLHAYIVYAHYLAILAVDATASLPKQTLPTDPMAFRNGVISMFREFSLENALRYIWSLGVAVLPLSDPGAFHGACWRIDGRNVIVLKQRTHSQARWLFDLLHEYWHVTQDPDNQQFSLIEADPVSAERRESPEEEDASLFAGDVILAGRAEQLAQICVREARGTVELLKSVVPKVAVRQDVPVDALANYMAFRLSLQGINWWGAAENLQKGGLEPVAVTRDILLQSCDLEALNDIDRDLLSRALAFPEE
ncbi:MAG: helix-turn-helix transcriptional regulator [Salinivirgaceae bacterium]|nr:helix-turn-helix transcriptional regulator [Salinivirgaceae bacterium]